MYDLAATNQPISLWMLNCQLPTVLPMDDQESSYKAAFAATVVSLRAGKAIGSQADLGRLVGVSDATIQRWEAPRKPHLPSAWELRKLAEALGVEPNELIYPAALTERERQMARRAARAVRSGLSRDLPAEGEPE